MGLRAKPRYKLLLVGGGCFIRIGGGHFSGVAYPNLIVSHMVRLSPVMYLDICVLSIVYVS